MNMLVVFKNCTQARARRNAKHQVQGYEITLTDMDTEVLTGSLMGQDMQSMKELLRELSPSERKKVQDFLKEEFS